MQTNDTVGNSTLKFVQVLPVFIEVGMEMDKFCLSSYKRLQQFLNLWNCIFIILKDRTLKI